MNAEVLVDFLEYGKRFLRTGTTDYVVLECSDEFMRQGIASGASMFFLGADGISLQERSNFNNEIGNVSIFLVQLNRDFGGMKKPYLFVQIQSRREDELDNGAGRMHRNFNQIRFTLLTQKVVLDNLKEGYAFYSALLDSASNKRSPYSWDKFSLNDYEGQSKIVPSGKKTIPTLLSEQISNKYFPQFLNEYKDDFTRLLATALSCYKEKNLSPIDNSMVFQISPSVNLPKPETLIYKLQLVQDLQAYLGWYYDSLFTFSIDDLTKRGVKIKLYGVPNFIPIEKDLASLIQTFSEDDDPRDMLLRLYSPEMNKVCVGVSLKQAIEDYKVIEIKAPSLSDKNRLNRIDNIFQTLLQAHSNTAVGYLLFSALENIADIQKRSDWIYQNVEKKPERAFALLSYLEFTNQNEEFLRNFLLLSDNQKTPKINSLFNSTLQKFVWCDLFDFRESLLDERLKKYDQILCGQKDLILDSESQMGYLLSGLKNKSLPSSALAYFDEQIKDREFQDRVLEELKREKSLQETLPMINVIFERLSQLDFLSEHRRFSTFCSRCLETHPIENLVDLVQVTKMAFRLNRLVFEYRIHRKLL